MSEEVDLRLERFLRDADFVSQQIRGLADGTLSVEDVDSASMSVRGLGSVSPQIRKLHNSCSESSSKPDSQIYDGEASQDDAEHAEALRKDVLLDVECAKWWSFSKFHFGDSGVNGLTPPEHIDISTSSALQPWALEIPSGEEATISALRSDRYVVDYRKWEEWVRNPDDALYVQEEKARIEEEERLKDEAFEQANPGFVAMFNQDKLKRELDQKKREDEAERLKNIGNTFFQKKEYSAALVQYHEALLLFPSLVSALNNIAACHLALKDYDLVIEFATRVVHISKLEENCDRVMGNAATKALFRRAKAHEALHHSLESVSDVTLALVHSPDNSELRKFKEDLDMHIIENLIVESLPQQIPLFPSLQRLEEIMKNLSNCVKKSKASDSTNIREISNLLSILNKLCVGMGNSMKCTIGTEELNIPNLKNWSDTKVSLLSKYCELDYAIIIMRTGLFIDVAKWCVEFVYQLFSNSLSMSDVETKERLEFATSVVPDLVSILVYFIHAPSAKRDYLLNLGFGPFVDMLSLFTLNFDILRKPNPISMDSYYYLCQSILVFLTSFLASGNVSDRWDILSHPFFSGTIIVKKDRSSKKFSPLWIPSFLLEEGKNTDSTFTSFLELFFNTRDGDVSFFAQKRWSHMQTVAKLFLELLRALPASYPTTLDVEKGVLIESLEFRKKRLSWLLSKFLFPTANVEGAIRVFISALSQIPVEIPLISELLSCPQPLSVFQFVEHFFKRNEVSSLFPEMVEPSDKSVSSSFWKTPTGVLLSLVRNMMMAVVFKIKKLPQIDTFDFSRGLIMDTFPSSLTSLLSAFHDLVKNAYSHHVLIWESRWHPWILSLIQLTSDNLAVGKSYIIPGDSFSHMVQILCWMHRYSEILSSLSTENSVKSLMCILNYSLSLTKPKIPKVEASKCAASDVKKALASSTHEQILQDAIVRMFMGIISKDSPTLPISQGPLLLSLVESTSYMLNIFEHIRQATYSLMYSAHDVASEDVYFRGAALEFSFKLLTVMAMCPGASEKMFEYLVCEMTVQALSCTTQLSQSLSVAKVIGTAIARLSESKKCKDRIRELRGMEILLQLSHKLV